MRLLQTSGKLELKYSLRNSFTRALILFIQTLALYKLFTYLLTYFSRHNKRNIKIRCHGTYQLKYDIKFLS